MRNLRFLIAHNIFKEIDQKLLEDLWRVITFKKEQTKLAYCT